MRAIFMGLFLVAMWDVGKDPGGFKGTEVVRAAVFPSIAYEYDTGYLCAQPESSHEPPAADMSSTSQLR